MASKLGICNSALIRVGEERISSLTEETKPAVLCNELYPRMVKRALKEGDWKCAIKRVQLGQLSTTPEYGFTYEYQLPSDCVRIIDAKESSSSDYDIVYKQEGRKLLTDSSIVYIKYISDDIKEGDFDEEFAEAIEDLLVSYIAYPLSENASLAREARNHYQDNLPKLRGTSGKRDTPEQPESFSWIDARS